MALIVNRQFLEHKKFICHMIQLNPLHQDSPLSTLEITTALDIYHV